jgi:hypothetical protein
MVIDEKIYPKTVLTEEEKKRMGPIKGRDCYFEVDYILAEIERVYDMLGDIQKIDKSQKPKAIPNMQRFLKTMERRLVSNYKIPLSAATREAFDTVQKPETPIDQFEDDALPALYQDLLSDMLNNYCSCTAERPGMKR